MRTPLPIQILRELPLGFTFMALVETPSMEPLIHVGQTVQAVRIAGKDVSIGDIVMYQNKNYTQPVIHRVIGIHTTGKARYISTKGDNAPHKDAYQTREHHIIARIILPGSRKQKVLSHTKRILSKIWKRRGNSC